MNRNRKPVERKVYAASTGAGIGGPLTALVVWVAGLFWGGSAAADEALHTASLVPLPVSGVLLIVVPYLVALGAGYFAKPKAQGEQGHTTAGFVLTVVVVVLAVLFVVGLVRGCNGNDASRGNDWEKTVSVATEMWGGR